MISLRNRTRRMLVMNLEHEAFCAADVCGCTPARVVVTDQSPSGVRAQRVIEKEVCASLTLLPRELRSGLSERILGCRELKAALRAGRLEVLADPRPSSQPVTTEKEAAS